MRLFGAEAIWNVVKKKGNAVKRVRTICQHLLLSLVLLYSSAEAFAAAAGMNAKVLRVLSDTDLFGGCMAQISVNPADKGLDCKGNWVSFSCSGDFADKGTATRNFELATVGLLTNTTIYVWVDDTKKHNGYCFTQRVDLIAQ